VHDQKQHNDVVSKDAIALEMGETALQAQLQPKAVKRYVEDNHAGERG
jgi:hypothetical protein